MDKSFFIVKTITDDKLFAIFVVEEDCKEFIRGNYDMCYEEIVLFVKNDMEYTIAPMGIIICEMLQTILYMFIETMDIYIPHIKMI